MAVVKNLNFVKGDSFALVITMTYNGAPLDLTGRTYESYIRKVPTSDGTPNAIFDCVLTDAAGGELTLYLLPTQTDDLRGDTKYFWDLQQDNAGVITTILTGTVTVIQDVTHP